ncbi:XylB Sugar (pentulose and hexulose) kinases [Fimbriimonadaceae bacterium]
MKGAIAVDLGASSARFAAGWLEDGELRWEIIEQVPHQTRTEHGRMVWDFDALLAFVKRAAEYGSTRFGRATLGIDAWGVDHGFLDRYGNLLQTPVCYRDPSHETAFESLAPHRDELYRLTGIQHQPFNTICQLIARRNENPNLVHDTHRWLLLPDLIGYLLTGQANYELSEASTTQLMGLDNEWSEEAFALAGWPLPDLQPSLAGHIGGYIADGVRLMSVGSHDTASAVLGLEPLDADSAFLNIGTWSLMGTVIDAPIATEAARTGNFTNERTVDGKVRFLKNVPGFWVVNRLHAELNISESVPEWIAGADLATMERIELNAPELFNPDSMVEACVALVGKKPETRENWAGIALHSLVEGIAQHIPALEECTHRKFKTLRLGGGPSRSDVFREQLQQRAGLKLELGPAEATIVGNLRFQLSSSS